MPGYRIISETHLEGREAAEALGLVGFCEDAGLIEKQAPQCWCLAFWTEAGETKSVFMLAPSGEDALTRTHELGINPGGEVTILGPLPEDWTPAKAWRNRLLTPEEAEAANPHPEDEQ